MAIAGRESPGSARCAARPRHISPGVVGRGPGRPLRSTRRQPPGSFQRSTLSAAGTRSTAVRPAPRRSGDPDRRGRRPPRNRCYGGRSSCTARNRFPPTIGSRRSKRHHGRLRALGRRQLGRVEHPSGRTGPLVRRPGFARPCSQLPCRTSPHRGGDLGGATSLVEEQDAAKEVTGIRMAPYGALLLAAYQGRPADRRGKARPSAELIEQGDGYALEVTSWANAVLNNGLGRYADAHAAARPAAYDLSFIRSVALSEMIEATVRTGEIEGARDALQRLSSLIVAGSDWAGGIEARGRALLGVGADAEDWYSESIALPSPVHRCGSSSPGRTCCTESGSDARTGGVDARASCAPRTRAAPRWAMEAFAERARRELGRDRREGPQATSRPTAMTSHRRKRTSPDSPVKDVPTSRSAPSCSSARVRSSGICARCSRNSAFRHAGSSRTPCRGRFRNDFTPVVRVSARGIPGLATGATVPPEARRSVHTTSAKEFRA